MSKGILALMLCFLLICSAFIPISLGFNVKVSDIEKTSEKFVSGGPMDSAWPMKCYDIHHSSQSPYSTADNPYIEKWRIECEWVEDTPVIADDGTIYVGGGYRDLNRYLIAINPNGTLKWRYETGGLILGASPAIAEDKTIYVGSWDWNLYAIHPNGTLKWRANSGGIIASSPVIAEDGTIYFGQTEYDIVAVNPNGTIKWKYKTGSWISSDPAIGNDGTIYIGSSDTYLYAMNPNGTLKWRFKTGDYIKGPPSIADDGTIYIGSWDEYLYALYPNGTMKWKCKIAGGTETNPSISSDGTIYVGGERLYAINPNGTIKWSFYLGPDRFIHQSSPTISADGTIYVGTNIGETSGGEIIAVNSDGTEKWRKKIANRWVEASASIAEDGTVYIGSSCEGWGYVHAFGVVESNAPPEAPSISGEKNGKVGERYWYTFRVIDPDRNPISFFIEWGDGTTTGWTFERGSEEDCYYEHTWSKPDTYTIRAKAKDNFDEESNWTKYEIKITKPRTRAWLRFLDMFPILQRILDLWRGQ